MDPDACLARLLDAFRDKDREAAFGAAEDLLDWLAKGGAMPVDPRLLFETFGQQMADLTALLKEYHEARMT
jgi:hypothetical protein